MFPTTHISVQFGCCFALCLLWFILIVPIKKAQKDIVEGDQGNPRELYKSLPGYGQRALYAHENINEGFVWFGFAILANAYGDGNQLAATVITLIYTLSRIFYVPLYIFNYPLLRTISFLIGFFSNIGLFILPFVTSNN